MSFSELTVGDLFGGALLSVVAVYLVIAAIERMAENRTSKRRK